MPLTFIAGLYGMNFKYMPELQWRLGYLWSLGLMAVTAAGMFWFFVRKGWIWEKRSRRADAAEAETDPISGKELEE
jgi:cytochrome c-type biogenesis protein CcmH/NrfF